MNPLKSLAFTSILIISSSIAFAQKTDNHETGKWCIKNVFYLNESQALGIAESQTGYLVVLINNEGKIEWEYKIYGYIWGASKFQGNIIAFYRKQYKELHAVTIDIKTGKLLIDKTLYTGSNNFNDVTVQNDATGNFQHLVLRTLPGLLDQAGTTALKLVTLAEDGETIIKGLSSIAIGNSFLGSRRAKNGHVFIASIANNSVVVEEFNQEGELENQLESPLNARKKFSYAYRTSTDTFAGNTMVISLKYENSDNKDVFSYFNFNFDTKQVAVANEAPQSKWSSLAPQDILYTKDKIILIKEGHDPNEQPGSFETIKRGNIYIGHAVVSVYDKQMHLLQDIVLEKSSIASANNPERLGCHIHADNLYILSTETGALGGAKYYNYTIQLNTGKLEKKNLITRKSRGVIFTRSTIWFPNELILSRLNVGLGSSYTNELEKLTYADL